MAHRQRRQWEATESTDKSVLGRCNSYSAATSNGGAPCNLQHGSQTHMPDARHIVNLHHDSWSAAHIKSRSIESSISKIGGPLSAGELQDLQPRSDQGRAKPAAWFVRISDTLPTTGDLSLRKAAAMNAKPLQKTKPRPYTASVLSAVNLKNKSQNCVAEPTFLPDAELTSLEYNANPGLQQLQTMLQNSLQLNALPPQSFHTVDRSQAAQQEVLLQQPVITLSNKLTAAEHIHEQQQQPPQLYAKVIPNVDVAKEQEACQSLCMEASLCFGIPPVVITAPSDTTVPEAWATAHNPPAITRKRQQWQMPDDTQPFNIRSDMSSVAAHRNDSGPYSEAMCRSSHGEAMQKNASYDQGSSIEAVQLKMQESTQHSCCNSVPKSHEAAILQACMQPQPCPVKGQPIAAVPGTEDERPASKEMQGHPQPLNQPDAWLSTPSSNLQQAIDTLRQIMSTSQLMDDTPSVPTTCQESQSNAPDSRSASAPGTPAAPITPSRMRGLSGFHSMGANTVQQLDALKQQAVTAQAAAAETALTALQQVTHFQSLLDVITHLRATCTDTDSSQSGNMAAGMAALQATKEHIKNCQSLQSKDDALPTPSTPGGNMPLPDQDTLHPTVEGRPTPCGSPRYLGVVRNLRRSVSFHNITGHSTQQGCKVAGLHGLNESSRDTSMDCNASKDADDIPASAEPATSGLDAVRRSATWRLRTNPVYEGDNDDADMQSLLSQQDATACHPNVTSLRAPSVRYRLRRLSLQLDLSNWSRLAHSAGGWSDNNDEEVEDADCLSQSRFIDVQGMGSLAGAAVQDDEVSSSDLLSSLAGRLESLADICYCTWLEKHVIGAPLVADADKCQQLLISMQQGRDWLATAMQRTQAAAKAVKQRPASSPGLLATKQPPSTPNTCGTSTTAGYTRNVWSPASSIFSPQLQSPAQCQATTPNGVMLAKISALSAQLKGAHKALVTFMQRLPTGTALPV